MELTIYVGGSISGGNGEEVCNYFFETKTELENMGFNVFNPMTNKDYMRTELEFKAHGYKDTPMSTNSAIKGRDKWMVLNSDIVYFDFTRKDIDLSRVSIGSMFEIAWAEDHDKQVILVMDKNNVHQHCFPLECATLIFETTEEAKEYLEEFANTTFNKGEVN